MDFHLYKFNIKLKEPISISFHTFYFRENFLIELKYKNITAYGEAAPFKLITGDGPKDVIKDAKKIKSLKIDPLKTSPKDFHKLVLKDFTSQTLKAGLDFAYHDLIGKIKRKPVYKLYSNKIKPVDNSVTIFVKETEDEVAKDAKKVFKKYPNLKILKIKLKGEGDVERTRAIKKVSPKKMKFIVDANQGFNDPKKAVNDLNKIGKILGNVILVEEPCPKGKLDDLKYVKENVKGMMVFADESAATIEDAKKVIRRKAAHGINIKLQKAGGIWPSKQIAKLCKEADMKVMIGCMLEGVMGISAGAHFAVSTPNLILSDLDSDLEMKSYTKGKVEYVKGQRIPLIKPGLGIDLDFNRLESLQKSKEAIFEKIT